MSLDNTSGNTLLQTSSDSDSELVDSSLLRLALLTLSFSLSVLECQASSLAASSID